MQVRCVECHEPLEVSEDAALGELTCFSCGSSFSLLADATLAYGAAGTGSTEMEAQSLGHFELIDQLGSGTFGSVWMARDTNLDRVVALKIPRKGQLNPQEAEQFLREARAAAQLQHPNIVSVHEVGRQGDTVYIVSDYVRGMAMDEWLDRQQITQREVADLVVKIADALHHAHEAGVIHRDLKPGNIMVTPAAAGHSGGVEPYIMDFGLAKREAAEVTMTVEGRIMGTPAYMPPEQARGEGHLADRRSDIYSLGVILYRLLTGELPFRGNPQMLILQILGDEPPSPRKFNGRIARDLETICLKCMEKKPEARYQTAADVRAELQRWLDGKTIHARPIGQVERLHRWARRNPKIAWLTGTVAALLVVIAGGSLVAAGKLAASNRAAVEARGRAERSAATARRERADALEARKEAEAAQAEAVKNALAAQRSATRANEEMQRADKNAQLAGQQRELAVAALNTLVGEVQKLLDDTPRTHRLKRRLLDEAFKGLDAVARVEGARVVEADLTMAKGHLRMGELFESLGQIESARDEYATAYQIFEQLRDAKPLSPQTRYDVSLAAYRLGGAYLMEGELELARQFCRQALDVRRELAQEYPRAAVFANLAKSNVQLGDVLRNSSQVDDAKQQFSIALNIQKQLALGAADDKRLGYQNAARESCNRLGDLYLVWIGDAQEALKYFEQGRELAQAVVDADPQSFAARQSLAMQYEKLGNAKLRLNNKTAARDYYGKALELLEVLAQQEDPELLLVQGELGLVLARIGRHEDAAAKAEEIRQIAPEYSRNLYNVACCYSLCAAAVTNGKDPEQLSAELRPLWQTYIDNAFDSLQQCVKHGLRRSTYLHIDPDLDAIRHLAQFQVITSQLGR